MVFWPCFDVHHPSTIPLGPGRDTPGDHSALLRHGGKGVVRGAQLPDANQEIETPGSTTGAMALFVAGKI